jgi:uncharacterized RDD family membrane protein YckC
MYCSKCGAQISEGASFCSNCGTPVPNAGSASPQPPAVQPPSQPPAEFPQQPPSAYQAPAPAPGYPPPQAAASAVRVAYAGFWLRLIAYIIDSLILGLVLGPLVVLPILGNTLRDIVNSGGNVWEIYTQATPQFLALRLLLVMFGWVYFALMESSRWQATLGKKALGLYVTDMQGNRITFARASGRYFGKLISAFILLIGFLMAGFTEKKQALHDILASCLVLRKL